MALDRFTIDTTAKLFIAKAGVTDFDVKRDLYSDAKQEWLLGGVEAGFNFPMRTNPLIDNVIDPLALPSPTIIPLYAYLRNGWRVRPAEADHTLAVTGGILLVDGGGDPFVDTVGAFTVRINYQQPVQLIGSVSPTASGFSAADRVKLTLIADVEGGRWDIAGTDLIFYKADNTTVVAIFEMRDSAGNPTSDPSLVFERFRTGP